MTPLRQLRFQLVEPTLLLAVRLCGAGQIDELVGDESVTQQQRHRAVANA